MLNKYTFSFTISYKYIDLNSIMYEEDREVYSLQPTIAEKILSGMKELTSLNQETQDTQLKKLEDLLSYLAAVTDILDALKILNRSRANSYAFDEKLFDYDPEDLTSKPIIVQMFEIADDLYTSYYSTMNDEDMNISGRFSCSVKDKVNMLMSGVLELVSGSLSYFCYRLCHQASEFEEETRKRYTQGIYLMIEKLLSKLDNFGLDEGYISVLVFDTMISVLAVVAPYQLSSEMNIPTILIRRVRSMVQWAHTKEFAALLDSMPDDSRASRIVSTVLKRIVKLILNCDHNTASRENTVEIISNLDSTIHYILDNIEFRKKLANKQTQHVQECIIRAFMSISIQLMSPRWLQNNKGNL